MQYGNTGCKSQVFQNGEGWRRAYVISRHIFVHCTLYLKYKPALNRLKLYGLILRNHLAFGNLMQVFVNRTY